MTGVKTVKLINDIKEIFKQDKKLFLLMAVSALYEAWEVMFFAGI